MRRIVPRLAMCGCESPLKDMAFCSKCGALNLVGLNSPFKVFGIEENFFIDLSSLHQTYLSLQNKLHPDRFSYDSQEKGLAQEYSGYLNWAYQVLKNPLKRAEILLDAFEESFSQEDLIEQMEKREYLETLSSNEDLSVFDKKIQKEKHEAEENMILAFQSRDTKKAKHYLTHLKYLDRLMIEISMKKKRS